MSSRQKPLIPVANPLASFREHEPEIMDAIHRALSAGRYIHGENCDLFEKEFAAWNGNQFGIGVGNGTQAVEISLRALGIGPGDEVITVSHTAVATVAAIELTGATVVLVDVDASTLTLNPAELDGAYSPKTKAVVAVHVYGNACDLKSILSWCQKRNLPLIEDCAQAHGAEFDGKRVGTWGTLACFSFYPTKNLGAFGDGGAILTNDEKLAQRCRELREYGWRKRYISEIPGTNSRLDEIQAAILRVKLRYLNQTNRARIAVASKYLATDLKSLSPVLPMKGTLGVFHLFVLRVKERDSAISFFESRGVATAIHYPEPVHLQPAYRNRIRLSGDLRNTERAAKEVLSLPCFPELTETETSAVARAIEDWKREGLRAA